ncbi:hypothetical protein [Actinomadura rugatobispora]|uniref:Uncharacterized protein n=1 Tax=Actinomadura rugatobispora TaxID=1994 RepID=A0ABW1A885_9ACTN
MPHHATFTTFGNPDGGREGRGELPGGASWAWQAKYLFTLDNDAFKQIDKSWTALAMLEAGSVGSQPAAAAEPRDRWNASSYSRGGMSLFQQRFEVG